MSESELARQSQILELAATGNAESLDVILTEEEEETEGVDTNELIPLESYQDEDGLTLLMLAAKENHVEVVDILLTRDGRRAIIDFTTKGSEGRSALGIAAFYGSLDVIQFLIKSGANPNLKD